MRRQALRKVCRGVAQCSGPGQSRANSLNREDLITEDVSIEIHYAPGERPLCGAEGWTASHTDDPAQATAFIAARRSPPKVEWSGVAPDGPCALPTLREGRMVMGWTIHDQRATH